MKELVVNADDFGMCPGVNKGIIQAHTKGIVTSTSLMVDGMVSLEAKYLKNYPNLAVGLHFSLADKGLINVLLARATLPFAQEEVVKQEFERQISKFEEIMGRSPDHLDAHHHLHLHPKLRPLFEEYANSHQVRVRNFGETHFIRDFYGQNKLRRTNLKGVGVEYLLKILAHLEEGVSELMCHPAVVDELLVKNSSYSKERGEELKTLTDPIISSYIQESGIKLIGKIQINPDKVV